MAWGREGSSFKVFSCGLNTTEAAGEGGKIVEGGLFFFFFFKMAAILVKASWSLFSYSPDAVFPNRLDYLRAGVSILFLVAQVVHFCGVSYICRMNSLSFREL